MMELVFSLAKPLSVPAEKFLSFLLGSLTTKHKVRVMVYRELSWNLTAMHDVLTMLDEQHSDHCDEPLVSNHHIANLLDYRLKDERYEAAKSGPAYHHLAEAEQIDLFYRDFRVLRTNIDRFKDPVELMRQMLYQFGPMFIQRPFKRRIMLKVGSTFVRGRMYLPDLPTRWPLTYYPLRAVRDKLVGYR